MGDRAGAARVAKRTVDRFAALPRFEQTSDDATVILLAYMEKGRLMSHAEYAERRDTWAAAWRARMDEATFKDLGLSVWLKGWVEPQMDDDDAREAVAKLPEYGELPPPGTIDSDVIVGITFLRAGRVADAIPRLEATARTCNTEWSTIWGQLWLGKAREATGDAARACEEYAAVLRRWGSATPRSVTADEARARAKKLGCLDEAASRGTRARSSRP
jgi:serine/threonine-protein kinase